MSRLIPVQYGRCTYPAGIVPKLAEIPGNFDADPVTADAPFSLHTEFSYEDRTFKSPALDGLEVIRAAHKRGVPKLWASQAWAEEFSRFVVAECNGRTPSVVEVHPPFDDYSSLGVFLECYAVFEHALRSRFPDVVLLVENRSGTRYSGGAFVLSNAGQLQRFSSLLDGSGLALRITLDIPQLFTAHSAVTADIVPLLEDMRGIRHHIAGIHLWGKRENAKGRRIAHVGDLNSYFRGKQDTKALFLSALARLLDDDVPRYFVPEVNSGQTDFLSIIGDLLSAGFAFC